MVNEFGKDTREFCFGEGAVVVGRDPHADVVLQDAAVSRSHAQISREGDVFLIEDLGSGNGTLVNDKVLPKETRRPLRHGDRVRLGRSLLEFILHISRKISSRLKRVTGAQSTLVRREEPERRESLCLFELKKLEAFLIVHRGAGAVRFRLRSDRTRVGRSSKSHVVINDPTISHEHAEIVYNAEGFHLVDRDSSFGTFLDGVTISIARLAPRSYVRFGKVRALFVVHEPDEEPPEASFALRDHLVGLYPDRRDEIRRAFRECRESGLDLAEELVGRSTLNPEEWWTATRDFRDRPSSRIFRGSRRLISRFFPRKTEE
jgi:pSer/pThr/pTyr-binding forkhead associated (FHA) protein